MTTPLEALRDYTPCIDENQIIHDRRIVDEAADLLEQAVIIISQITSDFLHPPTRESQERRADRAKAWCRRAVKVNQP